MKGFIDSTGGEWVKIYCVSWLYILDHVFHPFCYVLLRFAKH